MRHRADLGWHEEDWGGWESIGCMQAGIGDRRAQKRMERFGLGGVLSGFICVDNRDGWMGLIFDATLFLSSHKHSYQLIKKSLRDKSNK